MTRKTDNAVLKKDEAINNAKIQIIAIDWYIPHFTPSISKQIWTFELGTQEGTNVPMWIILGFQQRDRQYSGNLNTDTFNKSPVIIAQSIIGTEKCPDSAILLIYIDDEYSQGYGQIKEAFRALTKDDIIKPYMLGHDFRSSNNDDNDGYNIYVFDIRYQKN